MGKKLNTAQQKAVCHETGPMLVLAGPRKNNSIALSHFQIIGKRIGEAAGNPCADLFQSGGGRNEKPI